MSFCIHCLLRLIVYYLLQVLMETDVLPFMAMKNFCRSFNDLFKLEQGPFAGSKMQPMTIGILRDTFEKERS